MNEQPALPEVDSIAPHPAPASCQWCGKHARGREVEVEPARWTSRGGVRRVAKKALMARCCRACATRMDLA